MTSFATQSNKVMMSFIRSKVYIEFLQAVIILILAFTSVTAKGQIWPRIYNMSSYTSFSDMVETYDKGYILGGSNFPGYYLKDAWVMKTDINGNTLWTKHITEVQSLSLQGLDKLPDGGLVITGSTYRFGNPAMYFMKLNTCGEKEWCNIIRDTVGYGYTVRIKYADNGITALVKYYKGSPFRAWLFRFDLNGNLLWQKAVSISTQDLAGAEAEELFVATNHDYVVTGDVGDFYPGPATTPRPLLIRTDSAGNDLWTLAWGHTSGFKGWFGNRTAENPSGSLYTAARRFSWDTVAAYQTGYFLKTSADGQEMYRRSLLPSQYTSWPLSLELPDPDTLLVFTSWHNDYDSIPKLSVIKCDSLGNTIQNKLIWINSYAGVGSSLLTSNGKYLCAASLGSAAASGEPIYTYLFKLNMDLQFDTGDFAPRVYDSLCGHAISTSTINLDDCGIITDVSEPMDHSTTTQMMVFPNPATSVIEFTFPKYLKRESAQGIADITTVFRKWSYTTLEAYTPEGRKVLSQNIPSAQTGCSLDVSSWPRGLYYFRLVYNGGVVDGQKVLLR